MHTPQDRVEGLSGKLILEPAEIHDELDQGTIQSKAFFDLPFPL